jgi:hypothetical protein
MRQLIIVVAFAVAAAGAFAILKRPVEKAVTPPQKFRKSMVLKADQTGLLNFQLSGAPGIFRGQWNASRPERTVKDWDGKSYSRAGFGIDEVLGEFVIKAPDGTVVHRAEPGASWGNFSIRAQRDGTYTIEMKNSGPLRLTDRSVTVEAVYKLD